jgi:ApbE superfamily uncharacterized protein (UPF0280 family)
MTARRAFLGDGRLHLNHGPIDLIIEAFGPGPEVALAYGQAWQRFPSVLPELAAELKTLRQPVGTEMQSLAGPIARCMTEAVWPYRTQFITPMAAVAGAVAQDLLAALTKGRSLRKAYVNDGGDIALHLTAGESFRAGIVGDVAAPAIDGRATIDFKSRVRGVATSGQGGRSFSLGIADAVTVLARTASMADAAATVIANAVNIEDSGIERVPASSLDPDSDLGDIPVTIAVGMLSSGAIGRALDGGATVAERLVGEGLIDAAVLMLRGERRIVTGNEHRHPQVSFDGGRHLPRGRPQERTRAQARGGAGGYP